MRYALIKEGQAFTGGTLLQAVLQITTFRLADEEVVFANGERAQAVALHIDYKGHGKDSITYRRADWTDTELRGLAAERICVILERDGWALYRRLSGVC